MRYNKKEKLKYKQVRRKLVLYMDVYMIVEVVHNPIIIEKL